jgi:hypothetical protein
MEVVVLPTPPFWLAMAMILPIIDLLKAKITSSSAFLEAPV